MSSFVDSASIMSIADNIDRIRERMVAAAQHAGRDANTITLMAVSKTFPVEAIREAYATWATHAGT